ncbi:hypothetical protein H072_2347 [Dactylellina haptotyla CBS 200.50]|uniref:Uncharacterized protein n=1 Tax=Dactylellina haptotyla (strain CBS 200.50) TaxID=1284197 RepID=S8C7C9_DACHA|nr:hypothetical protein H072_2347 [Dactylellina haptotyla CBS 200.50]
MSWILGADYLPNLELDENPWYIPRFWEPMGSYVDIWELSAAYPGGHWHLKITDFQGVIEDLVSSFLLNIGPGGEGITLTCFGATPYVRQVLEKWIASKSWSTIIDNPLALLDLVMEGLFCEVDTTTWKMDGVFGPMEQVKFAIINIKINDLKWLN